VQGRDSDQGLHSARRPRSGRMCFDPDAMRKRSAADWLADIVLWGERLKGHLKGVDRDAFFLSTVLQDAASKCAEAIGEAAGKLDDLDPALNDAFPDLNLKLARRSRDRLSHGYYQIDLDIFWNTVTDAIPKNGGCGQGGEDQLRRWRRKRRFWWASNISSSPFPSTGRGGKRRNLFLLQEPQQSHIHIRAERIVLDEFAARLDDIAHQFGEDVVGLVDLLDLDLQQRALVGVARGLPELIRIHLAEAFVALQLDALAPRIGHRFEQADRSVNSGFGVFPSQ